MLKFSIIIPVKAINDYVRETVPHIQALDSNEWELIILPNELDRNEWSDDRIKIVSSGRMGPAAKRDMGANIANGEILVFLDDDSYPSHNLLSVASPYFDNEEVVAIGGPAITPSSDSFWQKVSGAVFLSKYSGGNPERYISIGSVKQVDDWPSVNFMVRRNDFIEVGGFDSLYWPGEDTKLCFDLIEKTNKKILYIPTLLVWHHRRSGLRAHLKQIGAYGLHRGYFAKKYPRTSCKPLYFMPTALFLFVIASFLLLWLPEFLKIIILTGWVVYGGALLFSFKDITKYEAVNVAICAVFYIFLTHLYYGFNFMRGLVTANLVSKLR